MDKNGLSTMETIKMEIIVIQTGEPDISSKPAK
jgi:hypothetical protein